MLSIGSLELVIVAIVALIFIGPDRLPEIVRLTVRTVSRLQDYWQQLYWEFKQGTGLDEIQQDIHNATRLGEKKPTAKRTAKKRE
jgi:sec-independent protein translocase protein TatB